MKSKNLQYIVGSAVLGFLFLLAVHANAATILSEDFEGYSVGTFSDPNWTLTNTGTPGISYSITQGSTSPNTTKYLTLADSSASATDSAMYQNLQNLYTSSGAGYQNIFTFSATVRSTNATGTKFIEFQASNTVASGPVTIANVSTSGSTFRYNGNVASIANFSTNTWYTLQGTIDISANLFNCSIYNTATGVLVGSFTDLSFINAVNSSTGALRTVSVGDFSAASVPTIDFDNLMIATVPEPTSVALAAAGLLVMLCQVTRRRNRV